MNKIHLSSIAGLLAAGAASAATIVPLDMPASGSHASGASFITSQSIAGVTFDISYTLNAFAAITDPAPFINSAGSYFGVGSSNDGAVVGQQQSLDADDNEQLSITIAITNFNAGSSGLTVGDITDFQFSELTIINGTAGNDGIFVSFTGFGDSEVGVDNPTTIDLTTLGNFSSAASTLYIQPDGNQSNNRWSVGGISVSYNIPEPSSVTLIGIGIAGMAFRRRRL
ncbi:PEP-CTERM sorting domain-containing protein [Haloferula chungangensis]|uniref:PEP-CTERM sorting domain-containing protein n=1 Tax=Haloferula chungangensis TaxID=1048331 RepID=A0ABW2LBF3_9BACT